MAQKRPPPLRSCCGRPARMKTGESSHLTKSRTRRARAAPRHASASRAPSSRSCAYPRSSPCTSPSRAIARRGTASRAPPPPLPKPPKPPSRPSKEPSRRPRPPRRSASSSRTASAPRTAREPERFAAYIRRWLKRVKGHARQGVGPSRGRAQVQPQVFDKRYAVGQARQLHVFALHDVDLLPVDPRVPYAFDDAFDDETTTARRQFPSSRGPVHLSPRAYTPVLLPDARGGAWLFAWKHLARGQVLARVLGLGTGGRRPRRAHEGQRHARASVGLPGPREEEDGKNPGDGAVHGPRPNCHPGDHDPTVRDGGVYPYDTFGAPCPPDARRDHRRDICPAVEVARGRDVLRARARGRVLARRGGEKKRRGRQDVGGVPVWSTLGRRRQRKVPEGREHGARWARSAAVRGIDPATFGFC